jgi:hypothetical protein
MAPPIAVTPAMAAVVSGMTILATSLMAGIIARAAGTGAHTQRQKKRVPLVALIRLPGLLRLVSGRELRGLPAWVSYGSRLGGQVSPPISAE